MKRIFFLTVALISLAACSNAQQTTTPTAKTTATKWQLPEQRANHDKYYARRATHFGTLSIGRDDIVMFGNSLTDGAEFNELFDNPHVKNRGIIGDIIQGLIDRVDPIVDGHPAKIFILSGVNDVSHDLTADSIARAMDRLITIIKERSPETKIYLQSMLPFNCDVQMWKLLNGREQVVIDANALFEQVAARHGVTWINLYPLFDDGTHHLRADLTNDGLHLMGDGYLIWRDAVLPYVNEK